MRFAFLCDFDGTISPTDVGAAFVKAFSPGRDQARDELLERWTSGRLGHRELTRAECDLVTATREDALAFAGRFEIDGSFTPFARAAISRGDAVMVVSEGFDFYVEDMLARAGLDDLPRATNRVRFHENRLTPDFPFAGEGCGACGNCKSQHVQRYRSQGFHTVLIGDGLSDRCGAKAADTVLARRHLLEWCRGVGVHATAFDDFGDVHDWFVATISSA